MLRFHPDSYKAREVHLVDLEVHLIVGHVSFGALLKNMRRVRSDYQLFQKNFEIKRGHQF